MLLLKKDVVFIADAKIHEIGRMRKLVFSKTSNRFYDGEQENLLIISIL
jgi:hypothetical protein